MNEPEQPGLYVHYLQGGPADGVKHTIPFFPREWFEAGGHRYKATGDPIPVEKMEFNGRSAQFYRVEMSFVPPEQWAALDTRTLLERMADREPDRHFEMPSDLNEDQQDGYDIGWNYCQCDMVSMVREYEQTVLATDTKRLDWVLAHPHVQVMKSPGGCRVIDQSDGLTFLTGCFPTQRQAIDAAMSNNKET